MLRRIFKWLAVLLGALVVALVVFVWAVLGVSPLFPEQDHLWELVSNDVNFFVRFPGVRLLDEPIVENLEQQPGYEPLLTLRDDLEALIEKVGRDVNPQVPLGLFSVEAGDLPPDIAFAGSILNDYQRLRPDSFVLLARIPWYGRFVSALRRGFVRNRIAEPWRSRIELVKGSYMRVHLDAQGADLLDRIRSQQGGRADAASVYVARIKDVLVISDNALWVENALRPVGGVTLPADPGFLSEFTYTHRSKQDVELYARHSLTLNVLQRHVREGSPLFPLTRIVPLDATGDLTVRATPRGDHTIEIDFSNEPFRESIGRMKAHLRDLYELEKGDIRRDFSEDGIGRFIPTRNTVAALVMHVPPERSARPVLVPLIDSMIPADERQLLDDEIRSSSGARFTSLEKLLRHLTEDLADTHLLIVHRPSVFEGADFGTLRPPPDGEWLPKAQLSFSLVSRVKDNVAPDEVRKKVFQNLQHLGMNAMGVHKSGDFHLAELINQTPEFELAEPAYGAMKGEMRYFVFSTSVEACEAIYRAAEDADARLVRQPGIAAAVQRLPREGTLGVVLNGDVLHKALRDRVRIYAHGVLNVPAWTMQFGQDYEKTKGRKPTDQEYRAEIERYTFAEYPRVKEEYEQMLAPIGAVDAVALAATLGVGGDRKIQGKAIVELYPPPEGE